MTQHPLVLIILDGWGERESNQANAIAAAHTPFWDKLLQEYPHTTLSASGPSVGLPADQMGNSEVGHLTMGTGRVVSQDLTRISAAIENGEFNQNPVFLAALEKARHTHLPLHLLGLLSPGGVHSHEEHLFALLRLAAQKKVPHIFLHVILDGRDVPPQSAKTSLVALQALCESFPSSTKARIVSICGRYYAMDRDKRWDRIQTFFELLTEGKSPYAFHSAIEGLMAAYQRGETDEFVKPTLITPIVHLENEAMVIFMNFRADRARQLSYALQDPHFSGFSRNVFPKLSEYITLTEYAKDLKAKIAFPPLPLENTLGEYLQQQHFRQLRIAETEKYAHVTFFFNGGQETLFEKEDRILIPSKKVATYDLAPEMSAFELTEKLVEAIHSHAYEIIICNYANADMVGHTGNFKATIKAIETLDSCLNKVITALKEVGGEALITADHGNAEWMFDENTKQPHTAHTTERVPFIYVGRPARIVTKEGSLTDIAPTLLLLLNLKKPVQMTGTPLIKLL